MNKHAEQLVRHAERLQRDRPTLTYLLRTQVERHLFVTCKSLSREHYSYDLRDFGIASREDVVQCDAVSAAPRVVLETILMGFELRAALGKLASGDPYMGWEGAAAALPGRDDAIRHFAKRLRCFAEQIMQFSSE